MALYQDSSYRTVLVLNKKWISDAGKLMNAAGHALQGLMSKLGDAPQFLTYDHSDGALATISTFPIVVLVAENSNQLRTLSDSADAASIACNVFVTEMFGASAEEQLAATRAKAKVDLDFISVAMFGPADVLRPHTKRFSLLRGATAPGTESERGGVCSSS